MTLSVDSEWVCSELGSTDFQTGNAHACVLLRVALDRVLADRARLRALREKEESRAAARLERRKVERAKARAARAAAKEKAEKKAARARAAARDARRQEKAARQARRFSAEHF